MIGSVESRHDPHSLKLVRKINEINSRLDRIEPRESLTPAIYGSCWGNEIGWSQANAVQNTWYDISDADMEDGQLLGVTHDGSGQLTVLAGGRYACIYTMAIEADALNQHIQTTFSVNGVATDDGVNHVETFGSSKQQAISGVAILDLEDGDTVETAIRTTDAGTPTLSVDHLNLALRRVSGSAEIPSPSVTVLSYPADGRLTLTTGVPVTTTDVSAAATLYYALYGGDQLALYDGSDWSRYTITELSLALGALVASTNYDIFVYDNAGVVTLEEEAWASATARATALTTQNGVYVKSGATTRRYLGTIRINSSGGQCEDTEAERYVWNYYNRVGRRLERTYSNAHGYVVAAWRPWDNALTSIYVQFVVGVLEDALPVSFGGTWTSIAASVSPNVNYVWNGVAGAAVPVNLYVDGAAHGGQYLLNQSEVSAVAARLGYNYYYPIEYGAASCTMITCVISILLPG
jgi:hypothetical protein